MNEFEPRIYRAAVADPVKMEQLTGQKIHPAYFEIEPQGCRLHVVIEEVPEKMGLIHLPGTSNETMGVGYVMAVGQFAGSTFPGGGPSPVGMVITRIVEGEITDPENLLYAHVIIGKVRGMPITVSFSDEYPAQVVVIDEREVKSVDFNSVPLKMRAEGGE
jgi:hypothetical protein